MMICGVWQISLLTILSWIQSPLVVFGFHAVSMTPKSFKLNLSSSSSFSNDRSKEGIRKIILQEGSGSPLRRGDVATVKYTASVLQGSTFARSERQRVTVGGGEMIDGWEEILPTMRVGERARIEILNPDLGYGSIGVVPIIPPNAALELDMEVLESKPRSVVDFDTLSLGDPNTPRTAESIAAAYDSLMEKKALSPKKEGLEGWIETVKGWYFFGFFEGETGEEAPWILKPSITFPLAFAIVGAAFWVSFKFGAIYERGSQSTDELDDIVLSQLPPSSQNIAILIATAFVGFTELI